MLLKSAVTLILVTLSLFQAEALGDKLLFSTGKEYVYNYVTLVTTGTEAPTGTAAAYKIDATLRIQAENSNLLNVKLENVKIGLYNGPWTYFPLPEFQQLADVDLSSLSETFQINTANGKFKTLVMNDQEQEWVSNMKRGLANYLQMDLSQISLDQARIQKVTEMTTMGECDTTYEVLPVSATKAGTARVSKFRNHADCVDIPSRVRQVSNIFYKCQDEATRNIINSTSYATYDVDDSLPNELQMRQLTVYSSVLYWPFTSKSPYLYTWFSLNLVLKEVTTITNVLAPPENPETHEDLSFVFEQNDQTDPEEDSVDLRLAEPLFFHHTAGENDPETLKVLMTQLQKSTRNLANSLMSKPNLENVTEFHTSPFEILPLISSLDYDSLRHCHGLYSSAAASGEKMEKLEFQIFLDGLLMAGTSPSALLLRDIVLHTENVAVLTRIVPSLPLYLRNPSEALAKEYEAIFDLSQSSKLSPSVRRLLELSIASVISKCCKKTLCSTTGTLDKYIAHFTGKLDSDDFETQVVGVLGLRNLGLGRAIDILQEIATGGKKVDQTVRTQAIWSLRPLAYREDGHIFNTLLPIFYDRSESCETRVAVFGFLMTCNPSERILHEITYFMWSETCPQTSNFVRTTLKNLAESEYPCSREMKAHAKTMFEYLPPGSVDVTRSTSYASGYYNKNYGFGKGLTATVVRTGKSSIPVSIYVGLGSVIGGYATHYMGVYIRMEGLGKALSSKLGSMQNADISEIQKILSTIGVSTRPSTPLKLEFCLMYHHKVVAYFAFSETTITQLPSYLESLKELVTGGNLNWQRSMLLAGTLYQQPMEIGVPISILASLATSYRVERNVANERKDPLTLVDGSVQFNVFGITQIMNHFVGLGTTFSASSRRAVRMSSSRQSSLGLDIASFSLQFKAKPYAEDNPAILAVHATTKTSVTRDSAFLADPKTSNMLKASCPNCEQEEIASRGEDARKTKTMTHKPSLVRGVKVEMKYFDCERRMSKASIIKKLWSHLEGLDAKSLRAFWNLEAALDEISIAPYAETCGMTLSFSQDSESGSPLQEISGTANAIIEPGKPMRMETKLRLNYGEGAPQQDIKVYASLQAHAVDKHELGLKLISKKGEQAHTLCFKTSTESSTLPKDILSYDDENEPTMRQDTQLSIGSLLANQIKGKDTPCASDLADIQVVGEAKRSAEQAFIAAEDVGPYKVCREQIDSGLYDGNYVPPTQACIAGAVDQTLLRDVKFDVSYKLNSQMHNKLRGVLGFARGILYPYAEDVEGDSAASAVAPGYAASGQLEVRFNLTKESPSMDVDLKAGAKPHERYQNVDLSLLSGFMAPQPATSRFSSLKTLGFRLGVLGQCVVYPSVTHTLDGTVVTADLPDCPTLISADCGKQPQYAILAKRLSSTTPRTLEILVRIGNVSLQLGVNETKLDGEVLQLAERVRTEYPSLVPRHIAITKNGEEVNLDSRVHGLSIRYTGYFVTVTLNSRYRGIHCGICGNWDSVPFNDASGPDLTCTKPLNPQQFFNSYVLREGDCESVGGTCPL